MLIVLKILAFAISSYFIFRFSRSYLSDPGSYGYFRFWAFELILILFLMNAEYWFRDPISINQLVSWQLLIISLVMVFAGYGGLLKRGKAEGHFENTTELVKTGIYSTIRHPMYSSLLFLTWGIFFKHLTIIGFFLAASSSVFLYATAKAEEQLNIEHFGDEYRKYMIHTKMFFPFIF